MKENKEKDRGREIDRRGGGFRDLLSSFHTRTCTLLHTPLHTHLHPQEEGGVKKKRKKVRVWKIRGEGKVEEGGRRGER